ncbi:predicted protein [Sclerotinia sclerotiorum 1980 UF-70]|uniref:Uncharacterized protein n=1 Tax=Sclerotinia sclerotiorum (strain ATCC 18683 / 1980 / Ss-1) TaxID=665079 RepID=A7F4H1_SCLS1|nr:predicted protein [Sclerotinia sclerotiorum 1980 UF-70]EDN97642.1 predicted protein [Sclerotinia sclerotiorum 1980 UF-70]
MDQWLRPVFTRTRTPVQSTPNDRSEDPHEAEDTMKTIRPSSRVSSYMGFRSSSTEESSPSGSSITTTEWEVDPTQQITSPPALETPRSPGHASRQEEGIQQERTVGSRRNEHSSVQETESFYSAVDSQPGSRLTSLQLDALERQHATEELGVAFDSESESDDTSSHSAITEGQCLTPNPTPSHPDIKEKPLPDIPTSDPEIDPFFSSETDHSQPWVNTQDDEHASSSIDSRQGFSFKTGDDSPSMLHEISKDTLRKSNTVPVQASRLSYVMNNEDEFVATPRLADSKFELKPIRGIMEAKSGANFNVNTMPSGSFEKEKEKEMERGNDKGLRQQLGMGMGVGRDIERTDSSSSFITAVRDNSGRSEGGRLGRRKGSGTGTGSGNGGGGGGRQKNAQGTAVMAAVRAIAAKEKLIGEKLIGKKLIEERVYHLVPSGVHRGVKLVGVEVGSEEWRWRVKIELKMRYGMKLYGVEMSCEMKLYGGVRWDGMEWKKGWRRGVGWKSIELMVHLVIWTDTRKRRLLFELLSILGIT